MMAYQRKDPQQVAAAVKEQLGALAERIFVRNEKRIYVDVPPEKSVEAKRPSDGLEVGRSVGCVGDDIGFGDFPDSRGHLAGDEPPPDEIVELELIVGQRASQVFRASGSVGGADGFVCFLCAVA